MKKIVFGIDNNIQCGCYTYRPSFTLLKLRGNVEAINNGYCLIINMKIIEYYKILKFQFILLCLCMGCMSTKVEYGYPVAENAVVLDRIYKEPELVMVPSMDHEGNPTIEIDETDPEYGVKFRCQHGEFTIHAAGTKYSDLYNRMQTGETVSVVYRPRIRYKKDYH